jgi:O-antigen ligase
MMRAVNVKFLAGALQRKDFRTIPDCLAVAVAVALPWSTSVAGILIVLWLIALAPTLDLAGVRRAILTPAGGLPVALWVLAMLGMVWADATWAQRADGASGYHKLLMIPLLFIQFRRSDRGWHVLAGYLVSVVAVFAVSTVLAIWPNLSWRPEAGRGVPAKDYVAQSGEFVACTFALLYIAGELARAGRRMLAALCVALAFAFLGNVAYVATGRTALVVIPVLLVLLGARWAGWRGGLALCVAGAILASAAWFSSPYLRNRVLRVGDELNEYQAGSIATSSSGLRLAFWTRSFDLIERAPALGNGTMSLFETFRRSADQSAAGQVVIGNPHNQILAVAIQLGLFGAGLLIAMWVAHLLLFCGGGAASWIGLVAVVQSIVSCLFNSHLFDFTQGWTYVFGVGVLGGLVMGGSRAPPGLASAPPS